MATNYTKKIKILYIHHGTGIGGAPISLLNLIKHLDKEKFKVKVAFLVGGIHEKMFINAGIDTEVIGCSNNYFIHNQTGKIQWYYFYRYFSIFYHWVLTAYKVAPRFLRNQDFDIVHLNSHALTSWAFAAHKIGKTVVLHNREAISHGYFGIRYKILKKLIKDNCDYVINISHDNKRRLGLEKNSSVIYNFVDIPDNFIKPMKNENITKKIIYLGGAAKIKGFETVLKSLPFLQKNVVIQIAGNIKAKNKTKSIKNRIKKMLKKILTNEEDEEKLIKKMYESDNVEILGLLDNPLDAINNSDILITPFKIEHFSRPAMEAFAYGKPVIGSDVQGMDEIIDHMINGILFEKNNPEELANSINILASDKNLTQKLGLNGREKAIRLYSPDKNTKKVEKIYLDLFSKKK